MSDKLLQRYQVLCSEMFQDPQVDEILAQKMPDLPWARGLKIVLDQMIDQLTVEEKKAVRLKFGLDTDKPLSAAKLAPMIPSGYDYARFLVKMSLRKLSARSTKFGLWNHLDG